MHPKIEQWLESRRLLAKAGEAEEAAYLATQGIPPPKKLRPATAEDVAEGNVFWYYVNSPRDCYWKLIEEVLRPSDPHKAFLADWCRYGLAGAMVEIPPDGEKA